MPNIKAALRIPGWMTFVELMWLAEQARHAKVIIEAGCWQGRSTRALADNTKGIIYAVDPWYKDYPNDDGTINKDFRADVFDKFQKNLRKHLHKKRVLPLHQRFTDTVFPPQSADLIFLDGDHRYKSVKEDILYARPLLKPGGILSGHDFGDDWPGVREAVFEFFPPKTVGHADSIWWVRL